MHDRQRSHISSFKSITYLQPRLHQLSSSANTYPSKFTVIMSFGYGVGDVMAVATLAWNIYRVCKDSPNDFRNVSNEVLSLHLVLKETDELIAEVIKDDADAASRLHEMATGCKSVLDELQGLLDKYQSMGTQTKRTWDRLQWGLEDIATIRSRLVSHTGLLTAFNGTALRYGPRLQFVPLYRPQKRIWRHIHYLLPPVEV
jgi:hypothetical protein